MSLQGVRDPSDYLALRDKLVDEFDTYVDAARANGGKATAPRIVALFQRSVNDSGILYEGEYLSNETAAEMFYQVAERRGGAWSVKPEYVPPPEESVGSNEDEAEDEEESSTDRRRAVAPPPTLSLARAQYLLGLCCTHSCPRNCSTAEGVGHSPAVTRPRPPVFQYGTPCPARAWLACLR